MSKLNLLLAIHCHQPVGNFGIVFSNAYESAYLPFIEVLERHPNIRISLHYSGSLLDWLKVTHPEFIERVKTLVKKGQVEILSSGYYEPILSLIPQPDAQAQIEMLRRRVKDLFSWDAQGCWLTERIWEPKIPSILNSSGIKWTIVDDSHFKSAGLEPEGLSGYYISEEEARPIAIFPASEKLRYFMPFKLPGETIDYLGYLYKEHNIRCICFADDGEKFGLWPGTHKWVYKQGWLEDFFTALDENSSWLAVRSFSQYLEEHPPTGRIYLSCSSYREMMEWSGGYFRNFLLKYDEANWMHKRMLYISQKIQSLRESYRGPLKRKSKANICRSRIDTARQHLYMAQSNDSYWHGVFGGLYLNHLRNSVYSHLIEAEKLINTSNRDKLHRLDLDYDGRDEVILSSRVLSCVFSPHRGGALLELDYKPKSLNLINTIMRRREMYHQKIKQNVSGSTDTQLQPKSIHDTDKIKQPDLGNFLFYDLFPRYCCLDHFLNRDTDLEQFSRCQYGELGDFTQGEYVFKLNGRGKKKSGFSLVRRGSVANYPVKIIKRVHLNNNDLSIDYTIKNESDRPLDNLFGVEFNLSVYDNNLSLTSGKIEVECLKISDIWSGISLEFTVNIPCLVWHFPVETISDSETGIGKTYQELCLLFNWQLSINPGSNWLARLRLRVEG